jgi:CRISPR-associated protein Cmr2
MKYLFICSIGPVQDFIATARRSRDLWYGSWMLSEMSKAAAKKLSDLYGSQALIFPYPDPEIKAHLFPDSELNVPNKLVAIVDDDPAKVGELLKTTIDERLSDLCADAFSLIGSSYDDQLAKNQVKDLPEFYWAGIEYENESNYPDARDLAETLLSARKNTRNFVQLPGANVPKSSLDGARESVIPESAYPKGGEPDSQKNNKNRKLYLNYGARPGERLSGVDLLKRLGTSQSTPKFKSTSHMAALPFLERITLEKGKEQKDAMLDEIGMLLNRAGWNTDEKDGALVFESRLVELVPSGDEQDQLREQLGVLLDKYAGKLRPSPYYSLLLADGDNMGKTIDAQKIPSAHRKLSEALSKFALEARHIIEEKQGVAVYAGGDDILAYLPLNTVLECASQLEQTFKLRMRDFKAQDDNGQEISPTLSSGIVIAHHLTPLSDVLELARSAEKAAKQVKGKNAIAITLSKRSGADRTIKGKWGELDKRLGLLIDFSRQDAISAGTAYELQELSRVLSGTGIPPEGIVAEALRIVKRKRESGGEYRISEKVKEAFQLWLNQESINPEELARQMIVAQVFAGAYDLAGIPKEEQRRD